MPHVIEYDHDTKRIEVSCRVSEVIVADGPKSLERAKIVWQLTPTEARDLAASLAECAEFASDSSNW